MLERQRIENYAMRYSAFFRVWEAVELMVINSSDSALVVRGVAERLLPLPESEFRDDKELDIFNTIKHLLSFHTPDERGFWSAPLDAEMKPIKQAILALLLEMLKDKAK